MTTEEKLRAFTRLVAAQSYYQGVTDAYRETATIAPPGLKLMFEELAAKTNEKSVEAGLAIAKLCTTE